MSAHLTPREQGDLGELSAIEWLIEKRARVYLPLGHSPDVDLVAEIAGRALRIEVKTSSHQRDGSHWGVLISTRGGNQSWNRVVKRFEPERCDYLFVHVGDGRRWFIPTHALGGRSSLTLGGSKYSQYEIEPGKPLPGHRESRLESAASGGVPKRSTGMRCKRIGSAFAGSNPASPITSSEAIASPEPIAPSKRERKLGQRGEAVINQKRRVTIPQRAFFEAGLQNGGKVRVRADGPGRIVLEQVELPSWARSEAG